jgi:nibrin
MMATTFVSEGAYATRKWSNECTHVLVDGSCSLTPELLDAVMAKKQIMLGDWFEVLRFPYGHTFYMLHSSSVLDQ